MNSKALILLLILVAGAVGAYFFLQNDKGASVSDSRVGDLLLPKLATQLNDLNEAQIIAPGDQKVASLKKSGDQWILLERNGYPADVGQLRKVLLALAQAKIVERKTSNPKLYSRLQVQPISESEGSNRELRLILPNQDTALIIGNPGPQINTTRYVRLSNEETSWLIDQNIVIDQDTAHWLQKNVFDIPADRIVSLKVTASDGSKIALVNKDPATTQFEGVEFVKESDEFAPALVSLMTNAFASFQLLDVMPASQLGEDWTKNSEGRVETFDGIVIRFTTYQHEDKHYAKIQAHFDEELVKQTAIDVLNEKDHTYSVDEAKKLVSQIRAVSDDWVYQIPNVTFDALAQTYEDMLVIVDE